MPPTRYTRNAIALLLFATVTLLGNVGESQDRPGLDGGIAGDAESFPSDVLPPADWRRVDISIERSLDWLANQQQRDGSFPTFPTGQPAVTGLCVMAFMSAGHEPGNGKHGDVIQSAIEFVMSTQREDGLFSFVKPIQPVTHWHQATHTAMYNHAIAGLALTEVYGMSSGQDLGELTASIDKALQFAYTKQRPPGPHRIEDGGWGYLEYANEGPNRGETDLSVTGWYLMWLRSAANAGFDIPEKRVQSAADYVEACFDEETGRFCYGPVSGDRSSSRGMMGAGILSLAMAGRHSSKIAIRAGDWLLENPVDRYNVPSNRSMDRFHYGVHYASHSMYQLGGNYWKQFYPTLVKTMLSGQLPNGAWPPDSTSDRRFGNSYTTALAVLSLSPPYQMIPIYQR